MAADFDVIVIGAGPAGLSCAAYLSAVGRRVAVVDRHTVPGGNMTSFHHRDPGTGEWYEFDVGMHYLGGCEPGGAIRGVLDPLGIAPEYRPLDPDGYDTFVLGGSVAGGEPTEFRVPAGWDRYRDALHRAFPGERDAIEGYLRLLAAARDLMSTGLTPRLSKLPRMAAPAARLLPVLSATLGEVFGRVGASPRLRTVLAGINGTYGLPPGQVSFLLHAGVVLHYMEGAWYPQGGGQPISDALAGIVTERGGEIHLRTEVQEILVDRAGRGRGGRGHGGRVTGVQVRRPAAERRAGEPEVISAPVVVSNADLKRTYRSMVPEWAIPARVRRRVARMTMAAPLHVLYLVLDRDLAAEGYPSTNWWVYPDDDIDAFYTETAAGQVPEVPCTYTTSASLKDPHNPALCRSGQTNLQVMGIAPADHAWWGLEGGGPAEGERYRRNKVYSRRKRQMRDALLRSAERAIPGIAESVVFEESATPITHERFVRSTGGTSYGLAGTPSQMALRRPGPYTPVEGLWIVGANTRFMHGIGGTLGGGMATAAMVTRTPMRTLRRLGLPARQVGPPSPDAPVAATG